MAGIPFMILLGGDGNIGDAGTRKFLRDFVDQFAARPAREGRNPQTGEAIQIAANKAVRFRAGKAVKDALNPPTAKAAPRKKAARPKKSAARK
jgi:hypothetical protein